MSPGPSAIRRRPRLLLRCALALVLAAAVGAACGEGEAPPPDSPPPAPAQPPPHVEPARESPARRGLWVLAEGSQQVLEHPEKLPVLLRDARAMGATDLFVQVYRRGMAWFDSSFADTTPYRRALARAAAHAGAPASDPQPAAAVGGNPEERPQPQPAAGGSETRDGRRRLDPLATLIRRAHAAGLRVHAWVNVLSLAGNRDAPILRDLGRDAVLVDDRGRSLLDYPGLDVPPPARRWVRMGTPAVWLDPAAPGVADHLVETFAELAARYPELDGLHLDYIRYPDVLPFSPGSRFGVGIQLGYGKASRERFARETGLRVPDARGRGDGDAWDDWRRRQVTSLVGRIREAARAEDPDLLLSAAVLAYPARAYLSAFQNWRSWLETGLLDFGVVMLYSRDDVLFRQEAHAYTGGIGGDRVWLGLGTWLFAEAPGRALGQIEVARSAQPAGIALFSWDSIADAPALRDALATAASASASDDAAQPPVPSRADGP